MTSVEAGFDCAFCGGHEFEVSSRGDMVYCRRCTAWVGEVIAGHIVEHRGPAAIAARKARK